MRNDKLLRNSVIFADMVLFMMLCYIGVLGAATAAGQVVVYTGVLVTAAVFVALCDMGMNWAERGGKLAARA